MKLYLAGPMTGYPEYNAPAFREAAEILRRATDYEVLSPVELDEAEGFDHAAPGELTEDAYLDFLRRDLLRVLEADIDGVVVLDGWELSRGAALEVHVARSLGKPIYRLDGVMLREVKTPTRYQPPSNENILEEAGRIVSGDRGDAYGHPGDDFERTAGAWESLFGWSVTAKQVALAMVVVKLSRLQETPDKRDSIVDIAGYARTYEMCVEREQALDDRPSTVLSDQEVPDASLGSSTQESGGVSEGHDAPLRRTDSEHRRRHVEALGLRPLG